MRGKIFWLWDGVFWIRWQWLLTYSDLHNKVSPYSYSMLQLLWRSKRPAFNNDKAETKEKRLSMKPGFKTEKVLLQFRLGATGYKTIPPRESSITWCNLLKGSEPSPLTTHWTHTLTERQIRHESSLFTWYLIVFSRGGSSPGPQSSHQGCGREV